MVDINKYLNEQLALAELKSINKLCKKTDSVSQKSQLVAEHISKKQNTIAKNILQKSFEKDVICLPQRKISTSTKFNFERECLPLLDNKNNDKAISSICHGKRELKKIIDDGNYIVYKKRVTKWRSNLSAAKLNKYHGNYHSADIRYLLEENGNPEDIHELENGLRIPKFIWKQLYKYQRTGVKWLWKLHQEQSGGMLIDEMGLGKTVQIIAFLVGLFKSNCGLWGHLGPSIIVTPATVIYQWVSHFHYWCPPLRIAVLHHTGSYNGTHNKLIRDIHTAHGILLISYAGMVKYSKSLLSKQWDYIIIDEGHKIKNPETQVSKLVKKFQTPHKVLITGSPMQNSLQELWSLFDFVRPGLLGTYKAFMDYISLPITQGGYANATELQKATALEITKSLKSIVSKYMLRRTKAEVQEHIKLPEKNEKVLFCELSKEQKDLYRGYITSETVRGFLDKGPKYKGSSRTKVLVALTTLSKICNHPDLYLHEAQNEFKGIGEDFGDWKRSGKMSVVHSLLNLWHKQCHRTLIFTQSREMIRILEHYLQKCEFKYLKMDGTVSISLRQNLIKTFNENPKYLVFLSTTRVGGLGVNLTGANRVILYDPDWNPATDNQAKERAWRIGQERNVTVYRLLSAGTIEEKMYQRQIFKNLLSNKIFIDPNQKNLLTTSSLQGLFSLDDLNSDGDTETAALFKHTKIDLYDSEPSHSSYSVSEKVVAMKKMAQEISRKISEDEKRIKEISNKPRSSTTTTETNLILDKNVTNVLSENVLFDVNIRKHAKQDYEQSLIKGQLDCPNMETKGIEKNIHKQTIENVMETELLSLKDKAEIKKKEPFNHIGHWNFTKEYRFKKNKLGFSNTIVESSELNIAKSIKTNNVKTPSKRKKTSLSSGTCVENLRDLTKIHTNKMAGNVIDDDHVLSELFAKETVKNALHHDIVGLAAKERNYKMKELAVTNANKAIEAMKLSVKQY